MIGIRSAALLAEVIAAYDTAEWEHDSLKETLEAIGDGFQLKLGKAQAPVRMAVTGRTVGPPLFESLVLLGREETLRRLCSALARVCAAPE